MTTRRRIGFPLLAVAVVCAAFFGSKWRAGMRVGIPVPIRNALARMPEIPQGIRLREIFSFLSLPEPRSAFYKFVEGRTGYAEAQYEIGFNKQYLLECEAQTDLVLGVSMDFEGGVLSAVRILKRTVDAAGVEDYEALSPDWRADAATEVLKETAERKR